MSPRPPDGLGARLARLFLTPFLGAEEAEAAVEELEELRSGRDGMRGTAWYWWAVLGYPVRVVAERARGRAPWAAKDAQTGRGGMDGVWKDLGYASRSLSRSPGFSLMAVLILALSMGAGTAVYSVVKGVLLDPLPIPEADRLGALWIRSDDGVRQRMTPGNLSDLRELEDVFRSVAGFQGSSAALSSGETTVFVRGGAVTTDYFRTLGITPLVGRDFRSEEGVPGGPPVVVLGGALWDRAFGSDPSVVGRTVQLSGTSFEVIGVVPAGVYPTSVTISTQIPFTESNQDYFVPLQFTDELWDLRRPHILGAVARLHDGVTAERADAALGTLSARLRETDPNNANDTLIMGPFTEEVVGDVRLALLMILGTVGLVLLIAVVNVGALFVLRGDDRGGEIEIRIAMGAPWVRLARQLVAEGALIVGAASLGALLVAGWGITVMRGLVPYQIPRLGQVQVDGAGLAVTLVVGLLLALGFGVTPALRMSGARATRRSRNATAGRQRRRLQSAVVALQAGLGVVVLVGAMLLARSFAALRSVDVGFEALDAWVVPVSGADGRMDAVVERVRSIPGVRAAAVTYDHPLRRTWGDSFLIVGREPRPNEDAPSGSLRPFGEGYFDAAGIRTVEGRVPDALDFAGAERYAVVNESLRDLYFPGGDAVGSVIDVPSARRVLGLESAGYTIVGVVEDVRFLGPDSPPQPAFYLPLSHFPSSAGQLLVRPEGPDIAVVDDIRRAVMQAAPASAVQDVRRLRDVLDDLLARPRFHMMLLVTLASMGLVLSGLGAYGLVGRTVVTRLREIGIRMALGADGRSVARSVLGSALRPVLLGGGVGMLAAAAVVRSLRSLLFGISPGDPLSFLASAAFLVGVGVLATIVPMLRALSVDPASSLRTD